MGNIIKITYSIAQAHIEVNIPRNIQQNLTKSRKQHKQAVHNRTYPQPDSQHCYILEEENGKRFEKRFMNQSISPSP